MDLKNLLYAQINLMGQLNIREKIIKNNENSKQIIEELMNNCMNSLNGKTLMHSEWVLLAEALMHYLLTVMVIPSRRKITVDGFEVSIIIPNARNIYNNHDQLLIIQFFLNEDSAIKFIVDKLKSIQPILENIWIVSYTCINIPKPINNYVISENLNANEANVIPFSQILLDILKHIDRINYSGFKIL